MFIYFASGTCQFLINIVYFNSSGTNANESPKFSMNNCESAAAGPLKEAVFESETHILPGRGGIAGRTTMALRAEDFLMTCRPKPPTSIRRLRGMRSRLPRGWVML